jgi:L-seryl-tRNA(Ser) seleniumtransferase
MTPSRRRFLKSLAALPGAASLSGPAAEAQPAPRDVYRELGVRPLVNAGGTFTYIGGSMMPKPVLEAMESASRHFVHLNELHRAVGARIAKLLGCEAARVTAGAASALLLGTAACVAGKDPARIQQLPDTRGMKNEVVIPRAHRNGYDHAVRAVGVTLVEVDTLAEAERAVTERTAMLLYFNVHGPEGPIRAEDFAALGRKKGVPSMVDAAADIPPIENYRRFLSMGFDLAAFSGGKILRWPQCSGLLLGRKDLIEAAAANTSPESDSIARTNKVGKEEIVGLWAALEHFLKQDPAVLWKEWERRCKTVIDLVARPPAVRGETFVPTPANAVPHVRVTWTPGGGRPTPDQAVQQLLDGEPRIVVRGTVADGIEIGVFMLEPDEDAIVGRRLAEVLRG